MFYKDDPEQTKGLLRAHHEEIIKPELVRLNGLPKGRQVLELPSLDNYASFIAEKKGGDHKQLLKQLDLRNKQISQERATKPQSPLQQALTEDEICTFLREFAYSHNKAADGKSRIYQLQPFHSFAFRSNEVHSLEPTYISPKPVEVLQSPRRQLGPEKENAYMYLNGTDYEIWEWTEKHNKLYQQDHVSGRSYMCWPGAGKKPAIYMKFSSKGIYFIESDPDAYPTIYQDSECHISISFKLTYGQIRMTSPISWEVWKLTERWPILQQGGRRIKKSDWVSGTQLRYIDHPSGYEVWDEPLFVNMTLTLSCSVRDWAWTIIDFQGWEDLPFWYLFDVWVIGATPAE